MWRVFLVVCLVLVGCATGADKAPLLPVDVPQKEAAALPEPEEAPEGERERPSDQKPDAQTDKELVSQETVKSDADKELSPDGTRPDFSALPGWLSGNQAVAFMAFQRSCVVFSKDWTAASQWKAACEEAKGKALENDASRVFFENHFVPRALMLPGKTGGLLTAYYEPELDVRSEPAPGFTEPIFSRPPDLVTVDPKKFNANGVNGRKFMGQVKDGILVPYLTRTEIKERGGTALAWGSAAEVFFLQVQGSGRLHYQNGQVIRAAFAGHNGHPYTSIGRVLIKEGELDPGKASKGAIEKWMKRSGPEKTRALMNRNKRYVFFAAKPVNDPALGPIGTQGAALTAGASLAVDPDVYPLGSPIWVDTRLPRDDKDWKGEPTQFLAIAQDTGGAINGMMRGDLFLGSGFQAGRRAGIVKHAARWWALIPRSRAGAEGAGEPKS